MVVKQGIFEISNYFCTDLSVTNYSEKENVHTTNSTPVATYKERHLAAPFAAGGILIIDFNTLHNNFTNLSSSS